MRTLDTILAAKREGRLVTEVTGNAREHRRITEPNGEDITDLVDEPETHAQVWNRFNGKAVGEDDLVPKPEAHNVIWDRFNGKLKDGKAA